MIKINIDPYGIDSPEFQTTESFNDMWCSALAHCHKRFEGKSGLYRKGPSGGLGCMTPDNFPIFDRFLENVYMIADANHGYKMIGVGELVAQEILGTESELLKPFRFNRYEKGELHPTSNSPFPGAKKKFKLNLNQNNIIYTTYTCKLIVVIQIIYIYYNQDA